MMVMALAVLFLLGACSGGQEKAPVSSAPGTEIQQEKTQAVENYGSGQGEATEEQNDANQGAQNEVAVKETPPAQTPAAQTPDTTVAAPAVKEPVKKTGVKKAVIEMDKGKIVIELFTKDAPKTVENFEKLAKDGFYDGLTFHRVIAGFMAQGGDPSGNGSGGPGYTIPDEINANKHLRGTLSMAHRGPNTGGSQFFICFEPQPHLDGVHTTFGQVVEGIEVMDQIAQGDKMNKVSIINE